MIALRPDAENMINLVSDDISHLLRAFLTLAPDFGMHGVIESDNESEHYLYMMSKLSEALTMCLMAMIRERAKFEEEDFISYWMKVRELSENHIYQTVVTSYC